MAYSVYAVAAAEFMAAFYERLFAGDTIGQAVTAGRAQLVRAPDRPSPKGPLPLQDWVVPVHYLRRDISFPHLKTARPAGAPPLEAFLDHYRAADTQGGSAVETTDPLAGVGEFVGRDGLFYTLEVALRHQRVVVLHGPGGTGKTELAKAFARWWRDTHAVEDPRLVVWHSFEPGLATFGVDGVINTIGLQVFGTDFARLAPDERRRTVVELLDQHRLLLVWDNFETVHTMRTDPGDGGDDAGVGASRLTAEQEEELAGFARRLAAGGRSALVITSRAGEDWLGTTIRRVAVGGLVGEEVTTYTDQVLAPYPGTRPKRAHRSFGELLTWLDGHPLAMRLTLPHLDTTTPRALLDALHGQTPLPTSNVDQGAGSEGGGGGRHSSLDASVTYSFRHLPTDMAAQLDVVALFLQVADADVLAVMSRADGYPGRFTGPAGETQEQAGDRWTTVLDAAAAVGLLTPLGSGMYRIHPALPAYLTAHWRTTRNDTVGTPVTPDGPTAIGEDGYPTQRAAAETALRRAFAGLAYSCSGQLAAGRADVAVAVLDAHRANLQQTLARALTGQDYPVADPVARALDDYWDLRGLTVEAAAWVDTVRAATENPPGTPPALNTPAGQLWMFMVGAQANRQQRAGLHDQADNTHREILTALTTLAAQPGAPDVRPNIAVAYHQLGITAQQRGRLDEAEDWCRKSLTIKEELGDRPGMASGYHQLGRIAQLRGRLDEAEAWCRKSLTIFEELGDRPGMAMTYGQLGLLAEARGDLGVGLEWMVRCVTLFEKFPHPSTGPAPGHLRRLTTLMSESVLEQTWRAVTGVDLPAQVRQFVRAIE